MKTIGFFGFPHSRFSTLSSFFPRFVAPPPLGWGAHGAKGQGWSAAPPAATPRNYRAPGNGRRSAGSSPVFQIVMSCLFVVDLLLTGSALAAPNAALCQASAPAAQVPAPAPTPLPGHPAITSVSNPVLVGADFTIKGRNFTRGSEVSFFVSTSAGPINAGPLRPGAGSNATQLVVPVPATVSQGQGFVSVQVVNTDAAFATSNRGYALLRGSAAAGLPSITAVNGKDLAPTSMDPGFATANVDTTLSPGSSVILNGSGFDVVNGVAVDVFCACPGGKLPTTFLAPGNRNLTSSSVRFTLPVSAPTGPASIAVSNAGAGKSFRHRSDAVSVPIGARINILSVSQSGSTITVNGTGFSKLTVINFFTAHGGNMGGLKPHGLPKIPLDVLSSTKFIFTIPAGAGAGPMFVQALNPPFVPFTSTTNDPCGAFRPTPTPAPTPISSSLIGIASPANGATVAGMVRVVTREASNVSWINVFVDGKWVAANPPAALPPYSVVWNSASVANGSHIVSVTGYNSSNAAIATSGIGIAVRNGVSAKPTPSPKASNAPTATRRGSTPTPRARRSSLPKATPTPRAGAYPLSDAAAAAMVVLNPNFEPRPGNYVPNHLVPNATELAQVGSLSWLDAHGNSLLTKADGNYTGTTDEILQWAAYKWGFDPEITRANAVTETHWRQYDLGDIGNGVSLGILQIKSRDYTGTCDPVSLNGFNVSFVTDPMCLSYNYTGFAADYKLAYQRACMDGSLTYLASQTPTAGYPSYTSATGTARLWGCIGDWFSGNWYDSGAISYIQDVQNNLATKPWLQPGF